MNWLRRFCCMAMPTLLSCTLINTTAWAQVVPSAYGPAQSLWVGAEYSNVRASFPYQSNQRLTGVGGFVELKLNGHFGLEGDARYLRFGGFENSTQSSYLAGPKAYFFERRKFHPYGKFLVGVGKIHYPYAIGDASYFALAPGAGVGYRFNRRWMLRGEYEYQMWLNSPGYANEPNHGLTPNGFHVGVEYRIY